MSRARRDASNRKSRRYCGHYGQQTGTKPERPDYVAERVRFELTVPVKVQRFSRPSRSTTLAPLRGTRGYSIAKLKRKQRRWRLLERRFCWVFLLESMLAWTSPLASGRGRPLRLAAAAASLPRPIQDFLRAFGRNGANRARFSRLMVIFGRPGVAWRGEARFNLQTKVSDD